MQDGFLRAAAASIPVAVADPRRNAAAICARIDQAHRAHAALLVLPELCVTGYTCGGLFLSALLLDAAEEALMNICAHTQNRAPVVVLGVPLRAGGKLYNCAAVLHHGRILGVVPKTWLPNYDVFAEKRCFASAAAYSGPGCVPVGGQDVPFGTGLVFACAQMPAFRLGVELCEDVWAPVPPSVRLCLAGATVIANCSASPEAAGKPAHRRTLLRAALSAPDADCAGVPCALTDFCFYHLVRCGAHPRRILRLARAAFGGAAADADILRAMAALTCCLFQRPAALPDHVTLGSGAQALRWPPDAAGSLWLDEIDALRRELS